LSRPCKNKNRTDFAKAGAPNAPGVGVVGWKVWLARAKKHAPPHPTPGIAVRDQRSALVPNSYGVFPGAFTRKLYNTRSPKSCFTPKSSSAFFAPAGKSFPTSNTMASPFHVPTSTSDEKR
jgi:hypothetical protein